MQEIMNLWKVCRTSSTRMNLTPHDVDVGIENANAKSKQKSIVRFCSFLLHPCKTLQNAQKIQRIPKIRMPTSLQATRKNGHVESNDRSQVHAEEEGKRETVSELVNA